jgi:hypothetical protein
MLSASGAKKLSQDIPDSATEFTIDSDRSDFLRSQFLSMYSFPEAKRFSLGHDLEPTSRYNKSNISVCSSAFNSHGSLYN